MSSALQQAAERIRLWREKPQVMVRELFGTIPDLWQDDVLTAFPHEPRMAMNACKGPGKTAVLAWLAWNFLLTRPHPKVAATSISGDNLSDGLWTEMAKWQGKSPLLREAFRWTKTRIFSVENPETWWMSARTWARGSSKEQQADTLAGLHAEYLLFLIDEAGGVPDSVMAAAEAGLANVMPGGKQEAHIVIAGNPTQLEGPLYRASTSERHLWHVTNITADPDDPKRTPRVSVEWARAQIEKYGLENPWVLVNVFGKFPPSSMNSLIGPDEVREAMNRHYREHEYIERARILGVDVAREGLDASCIFQRQGLVALPPTKMRNVDSLQGSGRVARIWHDWGADACFIDNTGGFGSGWIDQLRVLGRDPVGIHFSGKPNDPRYYNKRAEIWFDMVQWIRDGGALPPLPELVRQLTVPLYYFHKDQFAIEDKDQIKAKLGYSPDEADALALTFSQIVVPKPRGPTGLGGGVSAGVVVRDYDPFATT